MNLGWSQDADTREIGDRLDERLPGPAAGRPRLPFDTGSSPVGGPAAGGQATTRAGSFPDEQAISGQRRSALHRGDPAAVRSCWMCGIRLPGDQMVADGGSACPDLRWYCRDMWACTQRWTSRPAKTAASRQSAAGTPKAPGKQVPRAPGTQVSGADVAPAVPV